MVATLEANLGWFDHRTNLAAHDGLHEKNQKKDGRALRAGPERFLGVHVGVTTTTAALADRSAQLAVTLGAIRERSLLRASAPSAA